MIDGSALHVILLTTDILVVEFIVFIIFLLLGDHRLLSDLGSRNSLPADRAASDLLRDSLLPPLRHYHVLLKEYSNLLGCPLLSLHLILFIRGGIVPFIRLLVQAVVLERFEHLIVPLLR